MAAIIKLTNAKIRGSNETEKVKFLKVSSMRKSKGETFWENFSVPLMKTKFDVDQFNEGMYIDCEGKFQSEITEKGGKTYVNLTCWADSISESPQKDRVEGGIRFQQDDIPY